METEKKRGFAVSPEDIERLLADYGLSAELTGVTELQRYDYAPEMEQVRLILRLDRRDAAPLVMRLRCEEDVTRELAEAQSRFADLLKSRGVETPRVYASRGLFAGQYELSGYTVVVTLEDFVSGELTCVDAAAAEDTGVLLARMHDIAEAEDAHVPGPVLFDPLGRNDLFRFEAFTERREWLSGLDARLYAEIADRFAAVRRELRAFADAPGYAVQGDLSDCNLYRTETGRLGVFDYNRCGDSVLYYDAVMQAIFEARLMDYPPELQGRQEGPILSAFLRGYHRLRPFTPEQRRVYPFLYAAVSAFWLGDLLYDEGCLRETAEARDREGSLRWMEEIRRRLYALPEMPL